MGAMTSTVAAKFAIFSPNPALYRVVVEDGRRLRMTDVSERETVDVLKLNTKKGTKIVATYFKKPVASLTVLYSHGNAAFWVRCMTCYLLLAFIFELTY